jgi:hypothetical protein
MSVSLLPTRSRQTSATATLGLDLTGLGVAASDGLTADLPVEKANLAKLASYTRAAHQGGVGFVSLGEQFRLRSDRRVRHDDWLDPVVAARRISPHAAAGLVPTVPLRGDLSLVAGELAQISRTNGAWAGLQLSHEHTDDETFVDTLARVLRTVTAGRGSQAPRVVVPVDAESEIEVAAGYADVVRIREQDLEWARELRYAVRGAARAAGRQDVRVLVDLHTIISADRAAAEERAGLVADIAGPDASWAGALEAVGTVDDVVDTIQRWITAGAADGFVILPGSVPADVAALLRGVVPELRARGLVSAADVATRPTVSRTATRPTSVARARAPRAVATA